MITFKAVQVSYEVGNLWIILCGGFEIITSKEKKQGKSQLYSLRPFTIALSAWMGGAFYTFGFVAYGTLIFAKRMQFANAVKLQLGNNE